MSNIISIQQAISERDFGDSFETGKEVNALIDAGELQQAVDQIQGCVALHKWAGNYIKAALLERILDDLLTWKYTMPHALTANTFIAEMRTWLREHAASYDTRDCDAADLSLDNCDSFALADAFEAAATKLGGRA